MPITYLTGDATAPDGEGNKIIAHIVNDVGAWGRGFVLAVSERWPKVEQAYRDWHSKRWENDFNLGAVQFVQAETSLWVANMVAQHGIRNEAGSPPIRYKALERCLEHVREKALELTASIHMPRIGAGLAGGKWEIIEPIIEEALKDVAVTVYDLP